MSIKNSKIEGLENSMKNFISTMDWKQSELQSVLDMANQFKSGLKDDSLKGKSIGLLFFNPSLRTRHLS